MNTNNQITNKPPIRNKGGRPIGTTLINKAPISADLRTLLDNKIKWNKLVKLLVEEAMGGVKRINGNGVEYVTAPNIEVLKYLFDQRFGKPVTRIEGTDDAKEAIKKLSRIEQFILPKNNTSIDSNGKLTTESTTEPLETADINN